MAVETLCSSDREEKTRGEEKGGEREKGKVSRVPDENFESFS